MLTNCLATCTHLYSTVSQLFEPQVQKIAVFTYPSPHFVSPGDAPATITQYVTWMERQFDACQTPRSMYLSTFNSFRVIRCLSPNNCYFYDIFVSPGDAPGAITLNIIWMAREFDAYKLSRWMFPSNYNRFSDRVRYWSKIVIFSYPLAFDAPVSGGSRRISAIPFGVDKLELLGYQMVKTFRRYLHSFWRNSRTWRTDRQTNRRTDRQTPGDGNYSRAMHSIARQ